jgi:hypothetical protein
MELVRSILFAVEEYPHGRFRGKLELPGYSDEQIGFHVHLLGDGGLLEVVDVTVITSPSPYALPLSITWKGYEFLDAARSDTVWKKAAALVTKSGVVSAGFEVLKPLLIKLAMDQLGLGTGTGV